MSFDGLTLRAILSEMLFLKGAKVDKIYQTDSNTIILGLYHNKHRYSLVLCIDPNNYRLNLSTRSNKKPNTPPSFCMLLRKHLLGSYLSDIKMIGLERISILDFTTYSSRNSNTKKNCIRINGKA